MCFGSFFWGESLKKAPYEMLGRFRYRIFLCYRQNAHHGEFELPWSYRPWWRFRELPYSSRRSTWNSWFCSPNHVNSICSHVSLKCNNLSVTGYPVRTSKVTIPESGKMTLHISNRLRWTSRWWALQAYHSTIQGGGCGEVARWEGGWNLVHTELGGLTINSFFFL